MKEKHIRFYKEALKLFSERGFKGTTMRELANRLECDVANLYNYTKSKHQILETACFSINNDFHVGIDEIISMEIQTNNKIHQIIRLYINLTFTKPHEISLLVNEWRNLKEPALSRFIQERNAFENKVTDILRKGMVEGYLKNMDVSLATYLFLSSLRLLFDKYTMTTPKISKNNLEEQMYQYVLSGLSKVQV